MLGRSRLCTRQQLVKLADGAGGASEALHPGAGGRRQDLIHTNNSPNPASMRVPGRLVLQNLQVSDIQKWLDFLAGPVGGLYLERRRDAAKSTRR